MTAVPDFDITSLTIEGYSGNPVANRFFRQRSETGRLAIQLPGLWYTCDMPLLYYSRLVLVRRGIDVLQLHTDYTGPVFQSSSPEERLQWGYLDARGALQAALAQREYQQLILVGKSIGTIPMAQLVEAGIGMDTILIWLTPLLHQSRLVESALQWRGPALFAVGTGDSTYQAQVLDRICQQTGAEVIIIEGADHSLEIPGDWSRSLQAMDEVMSGLEGFLDQHLEKSLDRG